jgi:urease accessory protein
MGCQTAKDVDLALCAEYQYGLGMKVPERNARASGPTGGARHGTVPAGGATARALEPVRTAGGLKVRYVFADGATRIDGLTEYGGYRLRFPTTHARHIESSQINSGGGVVGGDSLSVVIDVGAGADAVHSTATAERIYRSIGPPARMNVTLALGGTARLDWLPQETILYSGARLHRRFEIDIAADARLLMAEMVVFGRVAHGEVPGRGELRDQWRIRRGGRLVFAEAVRLDGHVADALARPAVAAGARSTGLVVAIAPDAEDRLASLRVALTGARSDCGTSAWNGLLTARFLGTPEDVRRDIIRAVEMLAGRAMPRTWMT